MGTIAFNRKNVWYDRNFKYKVIINDLPMFEIANGKQQELESGQEKTTVKVKIMWCGSPEISIHKPINKKTNIYISPNKLFHKILVIAIVVCIVVSFTTSLFSQYQVVKNVGSILLLAVILSLIGMVTFGRNHWIIIKQTPVDY